MNNYSSDDLLSLRRNAVTIELPEWLLGSRPGLAGQFAGWSLMKAGPFWLVRNAESVSGDRPDLLHTSRVGTSIDPSNVEAYQRLLNLSPFDSYTFDVNWDDALAVHKKIVEGYGDEAIGIFTSFRTLVVGAIRAGDLPGIVATVMGDWLDSKDFANASMHLIEVRQSLGNRYGLARALLQKAKPIPSQEEMSFASSIALMGDMLVGLSAYLEPLVTSLSPSVWGVIAPRAGGVLLLNFGRLLSGRRQLSSDLISMSGRRGAPDPIALSGDVPRDAFRQTVNWWVARLDLVFSHITDPTNYVVRGLYDAPSALERMLNFEQICRSCQMIATSDDEHARRLGLFHVLDALSGLNTKWDWRELTSPSRNRNLIQKIKDRMPLAVQAILLPRAEAAVAALEELQDGFFLPSRLVDQGILRPDNSGVETVVPRATAASEWLRVIRNSTHGYDKTPSAKDRALLAAHHGAIPPHLADIAWLNLLRILAAPEMLQRHPR